MAVEGNMDTTGRSILLGVRFSIGNFAVEAADFNYFVRALESV